ncbi:hypothetical protein SUGI_0137430 [Cryptomeria japonica]|nr:hypothetical protein SUGI_0137430 [Cryptomeria japonica]
MGAVKTLNPKSTSKNRKTSKVDVNSLKAEVASFASSLGLASAPAATDSGFNDTDFRKTGPIKPPKPAKNPNENHSKKFSKAEENDGNPKAAKSKQEKSNANRKFAKGNGRNRQENSRKDNGFFKGQGPPPLAEKEPDRQISDAAKNLAKLPLMKPSTLSSPWYADAAAVEAKLLRAEGEGSAKLAADFSASAWESLVQNKSERARQLMEQYVSEYEEKSEKNSNMRMVSMAQKSGTTADRVAAITVLVQDNPLANLKALDTVLAMVTSKAGKRHAAVGIDALKELFFMSLLPDRKLKYLGQHPLHALVESRDGNSLLLFWYWEDCLKQRFERFVIALEEASKDSLSFLKDKALKSMFDLLKTKPEQERKLLSSLVNKLGDPERKVASNAGYHLSCLLSVHPNMKAVVIEEVDVFTFRPNVGLRARYHAVIFLNQILLSSKGDGPKLAKRLVDIYFALFKVLISKDNEAEKYGKNRKGSKEKAKNILDKKKKPESLTETPVEIDSRLLSALLTGVNRAFPYVSTDEADDIIHKQTPVLFQLVHSKNFNIGVQALMLLYQLLAKNQTVSDRFYRALYSTLLTPALMRSSKTEMLLGLMFKALKNDINIKRIAAFSKRLLQVALQQPPQFACACLLLLSELLKVRPVLWNAVLQPEDDDEDYEHFVDVKEEDYQVTENDKNTNSQSLESSDFGRLDDFMKDGATSDSESDDGENPVHASTSEDDNSNEDEDLLGNVMTSNQQAKHFESSGNRLEMKDGSDQQGKKSVSTKPGCYNPRMREPAYCNADRACWWELTALTSHVHPSVATMARTLILGANIVYNGDPLRDLSLGAFIDKFVEKKPKPSKQSDGEWHGGSQIAPARKIHVVPPLVGSDLLSLAEEEVPPEDVVFHKFYMAKSSSSKRKPKKKKAKEPDDEVAGDDLLVEGGGDDDDDDDDDFAGGDESDNEEIDDLIDQEDIDTQSQSDSQYDYEKLDAVLEREDDSLLADDSEDNMKGKKRKTSEKHGLSPFASLEDYSHLLDDSRNVNENHGTRNPKRSRKKNKKNDLDR